LAEDLNNIRAAVDRVLVDIEALPLELLPIDPE